MNKFNASLVTRATVSLLVLLSTAWSMGSVASGRLAASAFRTCYALDGGGIKCWGDGVNVPFSVPESASRFVSTDAGALGSHFCALTDGNAAQCFGQNFQYQLGDGTANGRSNPESVVGLESSVGQVVAGTYGGCALAGGGVFCWGLSYVSLDNINGLAVEKTGFLSQPVEITVGHDHQCVRTAMGTVQCWGSNHSGQLGNASTTTTQTPQTVVGLPGPAVRVDAGVGATCAIVSGGALYCWGNNQFGQLGVGNFNNASIASPVQGLSSGVIDVAVGDHHTCAILAGGTVRCWGFDSSGQVGNGPSKPPSGDLGFKSPQQVLGIVGAESIATGMFFSCAGLGNDRVTCWGDNEDGQLGDGTNMNRDAPSGVLELSSLAARIFYSGFQ